MFIKISKESFVSTILIFFLTLNTFALPIKKYEFSIGYNFMGKRLKEDAYANSYTYGGVNKYKISSLCNNYFLNYTRNFRLFCFQIQPYYTNWHSKLDYSIYSSSGTKYSITNYNIQYDYDFNTRIVGGLFLLGTNLIPDTTKPFLIRILSGISIEKIVEVVNNNSQTSLTASQGNNVQWQYTAPMPINIDESAKKYAIPIKLQFQYKPTNTWQISFDLGVSLIQQNYFIRFNYIDGNYYYLGLNTGIVF